MLLYTGTVLVQDFSRGQPPPGTLAAWAAADGLRDQQAAPSTAAAAGDIDFNVLQLGVDVGSSPSLGPAEAQDDACGLRDAGHSHGSRSRQQAASKFWEKPPAAADGTAAAAAAGGQQQL